MLMTNVFGGSLLNDFMGFPFEKESFRKRSPLYVRYEKSVMKTDIKETDSAYEVAIDLPGFKKEDISVKLEKGYLIVSASSNIDKEEKDEKNGTYIHKERYSGECSRSFYIGEVVTEEDIRARFENGILQIVIAKKEEKKIEEKKLIAIEG